MSVHPNVLPVHAEQCHIISPIGFTIVEDGSSHACSRAKGKGTRGHTLSQRHTCELRKLS
jgi:hypothetical protein